MKNDISSQRIVYRYGNFCCINYERNIYKTNVLLCLRRQRSPCKDKSERCESHSPSLGPPLPLSLSVCVSLTAVNPFCPGQRRRNLQGLQLNFDFSHLHFRCINLTQDNKTKRHSNCLAKDIVWSTWILGTAFASSQLSSVSISLTSSACGLIVLSHLSHILTLDWLRLL